MFSAKGSMLGFDLLFNNPSPARKTTGISRNGVTEISLYPIFSYDISCPISMSSLVLKITEMQKV